MQAALLLTISQQKRACNIIDENTILLLRGFVSKYNKNRVERKSACTSTKINVTQISTKLSPNPAPDASSRQSQFRRWFILALTKMLDKSNAFAMKRRIWRRHHNLRSFLLIKANIVKNALAESIEKHNINAKAPPGRWCICMEKKEETGQQLQGLPPHEAI